MRQPRTIWILEKNNFGGSEYHLTDRVYFDKEKAELAAKVFTENSIGLKFRALPFKEKL